MSLKSPREFHTMVVPVEKMIILNTVGRLFPDDRKIMCKLRDDTGRETAGFASIKIVELLHPFEELMDNENRNPKYLLQHTIEREIELVQEAIDLFYSLRGPLGGKMPIVAAMETYIHGVGSPQVSALFPEKQP